MNRYVIHRRTGGGFAGMIRRLVAVIALMSSSAINSQAATLNFDDLTSGILVTNPYNGFTVNDWSRSLTVSSRQRQQLLRSVRPECCLQSIRCGDDIDHEVHAFYLQQDSGDRMGE